MSNPNIAKNVVEKSRWLAAVGLGFLALGGNQVTTPTAQADDSPAMEYNIGANPYHLTDQERGELVEAREKECGGVFAPEACWDFTGLSPNLWTQSLIKFTPIIPIPGSNNEGMTNDTFTRVPLFVPAQEK